MPKNVFEQISEVNNDIQRNAFDWSHINNFTAKIGYIYPIFTELVPANSKFECNANLGLQFMPMKFPVQTQLKTRVSFFKVPLRTLWKDYKDWVGGFRNDIEPPYIDSDTPEKFDSMFSVGSLGDFLDITNVKYIGSDNEYTPLFRFANGWVPVYFGKSGKVTLPSVGSTIYNSISPLDADAYSELDTFTVLFSVNYNMVDTDKKFVEGNFYNFDIGKILPNKPEVFQALTPNIYTTADGLRPYFLVAFKSITGEVVHLQTLGLDLYSSLVGFSDDSNLVISTKDTLNFTSFRFDTTNVPQSTLDTIHSISFVIGYQIPISSLESSPNSDTLNTVLSGSRVLQPTLPFLSEIPFVNDNVVSGSYEVINTENTPYYSSNFNPDGLKLKAYRARAYEAIYNGYIRYSRNNPFYINGKVSYNEWIPNNDGGADNYHYQLHRANWELDMLTSAVSSPQQGKSPLVGLTQYITTEPDGATGQMLQSYQMALVDEDGKKYRVKFSTDADGYVQAAVGKEDEFEGYVEPLSYNKLVSSNTDYGISIPDLRVVNAYQKYLELNQRKGYSYKDIIEGRFDVKVKYDDLLLPEFIGGYTRNVQMNRVIQSVDLNRGSDNPNYAGALGSLAGDAFLSTDDTPRISTFCDEECIIMGIMSVVPVPTYSQILPKDYLYNDILDHFQPEFNNLGFQPIRYAEVCPLQLKDFGLSPDDVFGYQRPWYEYVQKLDRVHGQMRTNMRDFLFNRVFVNVPKLTESFLLVDPKHLNDVFQYTDDDDKIVGQIYFSCKADLPIHRVAIGRLE